MNQIRLTKSFEFEMAHALYNYDGLCKNIHGHSYILSITVIGAPVNNPKDPQFGMVIDFKTLKHIVKHNIINHYDHALLIYKDTPKSVINSLKENYEKIHVTHFQPTCESLLFIFRDILKKYLPETVKLYSLKIQETSTSFAEWFADDNG